MWSGGLTFGCIITWTCLRKLMMWESLFFSPRGMGRHCETGLQKEDMFLRMSEVGNSGYTFERMRRVVGRTRGINSCSEPSNCRPFWTALMTASLERKYTAMRPLEMRDADITSSAGIVAVMALMYDCIDTLSVAWKETPLSRVTFLNNSELGTVEVDGPAAVLDPPDWPGARWLCAWLAIRASQCENRTRVIQNIHLKYTKIIGKYTISYKPVYSITIYKATGKNKQGPRRS